MKQDQPLDTLQSNLKDLQDIADTSKPLQKVSKRVMNARILFVRSFLLLIFIVLAVLTMLVKYFTFFPFDLKVTRAIQMFHPIWFDLLMKFLTNIGYSVPATILVAIFVIGLFLKKARREAVMLTLSTLGIEMIAAILKVIIRRPRPDPTLIRQFTHFTTKDSFPSGHVSFYMGFFGFLFFLSYVLLPKKRYRAFFMTLCGLLIVGIGFSRIYLGAHWFSDVCAAYLLGILWLSFMIYLYRHVKLEQIILKNIYTKIFTFLFILFFLIITFVASVNVSDILHFLHR